MRIGELVLRNGLMLAPMAGVSDLPFRLLCRAQGAELAVTEMVSAKAMHYKNKATEELLKSCEGDRPLAVQLFGSEPEICAEAAEALSERSAFALIDFNMGCPMPKIVNNGDGSKLMTKPELAAEIIAAMVKKSKKPVCVKMRAGFTEEEKNAPELAKRLEAAGAAMLTVHGRTREQYYAGTADWDIIRQVKEAISIPVIGNGDVVSGESAARMLRETGCDGIAVGRAAEGNPWIFREIRHYLETGENLPPPDIEERFAVMRRHLVLEVEADGERMAVRKLRSHFAWYLHGFPNAAKWRHAINTAESQEVLLEILESVFQAANRLDTAECTSL